VVTLAVRVMESAVRVKDCVVLPTFAAAVEIVPRSCFAWVAKPESSSVN